MSGAFEALAFDPEGDLYAIEDSTDSLYRIDVATGARETFAVLPTGVDNITKDAEGRLFIAAHPPIKKIDLIPNLKPRDIVANGLDNPSPITAQNER